MNNAYQPLYISNPEASRHLALSMKYLLGQDFKRAGHYARLPTVLGHGNGALHLINSLMLSRKFEAVAEVAATMFANPMPHGTRVGLLEMLIPALMFLGIKDGNCTEAYSLAHELAAHGNLNPERARWQGQPLAGKSLLLTLSGDGFGGNGDYIMWARFIPYVAALGPQITVQCPPLLARLFATIPGVMATCGYEDRPECDYAVSILELPHVLGMTGAPLENPFNVQAVAFPAETHNIGINWGASWTAPYADRTCALAEYLPLTRIPSAALHALQKGPHQKQLYPPPTGMVVNDLGPRLGDFLDTAIALSSMDAVVTTDNVVANLACMLGRPTFVLVPKAADWRWGEGGRAPWYPSARVYQQAAIGEWAMPIALLTEDLTAFLRECSRQLPNSVEDTAVQATAAENLA